jgi:ABC-type Na+ efflux pump permease subunit
MKKLVLMFVVMLGIMTAVNAQTSPLKDYLGKYVFAAGSPVSEAVVEAEDSTLKVSSPMGSFTLEKKGVDTFYLAAYDGLVIFKRDANKSVESVTFVVQGMELVGTKEAASLTSGNKEEEFHYQIWAEKVEN